MHCALAEIMGLDPAVNYGRIVYLRHDAGTGVCAVSKVCGAADWLSGGAFIERTLKRYDDTELPLSAIVEHGLDSERGKAAMLVRAITNGVLRVFPARSKPKLRTTLKTLSYPRGTGSRTWGGCGKVAAWCDAYSAFLHFPACRRNRFR